MRFTGFGPLDMTRSTPPLLGSPRPPEDLDYPRLLALQQADGPGIVLLRGGSYSDAEMRLLDRVLARSASLDLEHSIVVVTRQRIRRRPLPIDE